MTKALGQTKLIPYFQLDFSDFNLGLNATGFVRFGSYYRLFFACLHFPLLLVFCSCYLFDSPTNTVPSYGYFDYSFE